MQITTNAVLNLQTPDYTVIYEPQGNNLSRFVHVQLMDGSAPWTVPTGTLMTVRYLKPDGTFGMYDTNENNASAYTISGSTVDVELVSQMLTVAGNVAAQLDFYNAAGQHLSTFSFRVAVEESPITDGEIESSDYFNVLTATLAEAQQIWLQVKSAYGAPRTANTAAAMTDQSLIYVYTGTTTSALTKGHWYFWNGSAWTDGGVYNSTAFETDPTLTISGAAADAKATGDTISIHRTEYTGNSTGLINNIGKLFFGDSEAEMTWQNGQRGASAGGSSGVVGAGTYFSCSSLISVNPGEILTLINLMPNKYRFAIRSYTETPENSGVYISGTSAAQLLKDNLEPSGSAATVYSNTSAWVFKNTVAILQNAAASTAKYWSVHVRRLSTDATEGRYQPYDLPEIQNAFHLYRASPRLNDYFKPSSSIGEFGFWMVNPAGAIQIDEENNAIRLSGAYIIYTRSQSILNPPTDFSAFDSTRRMTFYYDRTANRISAIPSSEYSGLENVENTVYLGCSWQKTSSTSGSYFINTDAAIVVNGFTQAPAWYERYKDETNPITSLSVVVAGDSICRGGRNGGRGFVGDIGCKFVNIGVGGASLSNIVDSSGSSDAVHVMGASNIPDQIVKYAAQSAQSWYIEPDAIIADGGINDYSRNAPLGTVPTAPARNDTDAAALDLTTVTGGLSFLCYQMVKLFPNAHRFFLLMNRVANKPWVANTAGYTQTELNEAITAVCKLYSVDVIDVFNQSLISSTFSQYVSPTPYRDDHSITDLFYIDSDMIHPLALGYRTGYAPLVREALRKAINA